MRPFDRSRIHFRSVLERRSKLRIEDIAVDPDAPAPDAGRDAEALDRIAGRIRDARRRGAPVILCHGAHLVKNGLGPLVARLLEEGWITHVATNGAGSIHDWEFACIGRSTEDVRENVAVGEFGIWDETGGWIGLALHLGALDGLGYGASIGRMIETERLDVPEAARLREKTAALLAGGGGPDAAEACAALCDAVAVLEACGPSPGEIRIPHPWKRYSLQAAAWRLGVPLTIHPGIGQDIVYSHPRFRGGAVGRTSMADFLLFASSIERLEGGVYLSVGSSVMSPMIFEKALSMSRNVLGLDGRTLEDFDIVVNDLAEMAWDWRRGEPPASDPAYYVRFCKSFSRMGGRFSYVGLDNRAFLQNLRARL